MRPTFLSFQTAARAMAASQAQIGVTGNNMANMDTPGYTRQRVDLNAITSSGYNQRFITNKDFTDAGVQVSGTSQLRDPFLDARFRTENAENGKYAALLEGLKDLENNIDEFSTQGIQNELSNFISQLQELAKTAENQDMMLVVRAAAQKITTLMNTYSTQIDQARKQQIFDLENVTINTQFNSIVKNIASLNEQIQKEELYGNTPNDLYDQRNLLIDQLSGIANIKATITPQKISEDVTVGRMTIVLYDAKTSTSIGLVDNNLYNTLTVNNSDLPMTISINTSFMLPDTPAHVDVGNITKYFSSGVIGGSLELINGNGNYAQGEESGFRGVPYYQSAVDTLAAKFAEVFNGINAAAGGGDLFSSGRSGGPITAKNIQVSAEWMADPTVMITSTDPTNPSLGDQVQRMIEAMNSPQSFYKPPGSAGDLLFTGSFHGYTKGLIGELSLDVQLNTNFAKTSNSVMADLFERRESISGINMDEEGINLMTSQKAYNAAARYFTVLDEGVDTIINKMGLVGR